MNAAAPAPCPPPNRHAAHQQRAANVVSIMDGAKSTSRWLARRARDATDTHLGTQRTQSNPDSDIPDTTPIWTAADRPPRPAARAQIVQLTPPTHNREPYDTLLYCPTSCSYRSVCGTDAACRLQF